MSFDPELFGQAMAETIQKAIAPLREEIADLHRQLSESKSIEDIVRQAVADEVGKLPAPRDADEGAIAERVTQAIKGDLEEWKRKAESSIKAPDLHDIKGMIDPAISEAVKAIPAPKDGKSVTIEDVRPLVDKEIQRLRADADEYFKEVLGQAEQARDALIKAYANLRQPEDGKPFTLSDAQPAIEAAVESIRSAAEGAVSAAVARADDAAQKASAVAAGLHQPEDGKSVTLEDIRPVLDVALDEIRTRADENIGAAVAAVERAVEAAEERAQSLRQPEDGKSITLDDVMPTLNLAVEEMHDQVDRRLKEVHEVIEGARQAVHDAQAAAERAESLRQPEDGKSVSIEDVRPIIEDQIKQAVAAIPAPKDGIGLAGMLIDRDGNLIATMTNGEAKNLGPVVGKDGLSLESFSMEYDATAHEVVLKASASGRTREVRYPAGGIHGKGYWREGLKAKAGEAWTHDGSLWCAKKDTSATPEPKSEDWFMAARKGRDGESTVRRVKEGAARPIKLGGSDASHD